MALHRALTKNRRLSLAQKAAVLSCLVCGGLLESCKRKLCGSAACAVAWKAARDRWRRRIRQARRAVAAARAAKRIDLEAAALLAADQAIEARLLWARALFEKEFEFGEGET